MAVFSEVGILEFRRTTLSFEQFGDPLFNRAELSVVILNETRQAYTSLRTSSWMNL